MIHLTAQKGGNNMEKKRWSLIFIGLCLALAFSVSSVEAQCPDNPKKEKGQNKCNDSIDNDCDGLFDGDDPDCGGEEPPELVTLVICHFKNILKHCKIGEQFVGGGERTVEDFNPDSPSEVRILARIMHKLL